MNLFKGKRVDDRYSMKGNFTYYRVFVPEFGAGEYSLCFQKRGDARDYKRLLSASTKCLHAKIQYITSEDGLQTVREVR